MKRAVIDHYGPPEMIRIEEVKSYPHEGDDIIVENYASSVNPVDYKVGNGSIRFLSGMRFPKQLGGDFSGIVTYSNNVNFPVGTEVFGYLNAIRGGACAEEIIVKPRNLARKPGNLTLYEAGVLSIGAMTAFEGIMSKGRTEKGSKVFINGCTGGVGAFATMIAVALGAEVTGTCSEKNMEFARQLGVHRVFDYNNSGPDEIGNDFDLVYETFGKISWSDLKKYGRKGTRFITCAVNRSLIMNALIRNNLKIIVIRPDSSKLSFLGALIEKLNIKPVISGEYGLEELGSAHASLEAGGIRGKILIRIR